MKAMPKLVAPLKSKLTLSCCRTPTSVNKLLGWFPYPGGKNNKKNSGKFKTQQASNIRKQRCHLVLSVPDLIRMDYFGQSYSKTYGLLGVELKMVSL